MISNFTITKLVEKIADDKKNSIVNKIADALKNSLEGKRISTKRIDLILSDFLKELRGEETI